MGVCAYLGVGSTLPWIRFPQPCLMMCEEKWPWFAVLPLGVQFLLGGLPVVVAGILSEPGGPALARLYLQMMEWPRACIFPP